MQCDSYATAGRGIEADVAAETVRKTGLNQVLRCAAEAHEEVVVVRVDGRAAPCEVGENRNDVSFEFESPALSVVARRRKGRVTNEFTLQCGIPRDAVVEWTPRVLNSRGVRIVG